MQRLVFAALTICVGLTGCCGKNSLSGSVSQVYTLDFQTVTGSFDGDPVNVLTIAYLKGADATTGYTMKVVVDLNGLTITPGVAIDLTQTSNGQQRGSFEQILSTNDVQLPFSTASLTLDEAPVVGKELSGKFAATFTDPAGHAVQGNFDIAKLTAVSR